MSLHPTLENKVIIISGSTSGTGKAIALRCAELGAKGVVVTGRNAPRGEDTVDAIEAIGKRTGVGTDAVFVKADLNDPAQCQTIVDVCEKKFGTAHGLVNAAGRGTRASLENTSVEVWDEIVNLHLRAPFLLTQAATTLMKANGNGGAVVNIGSTAAHGGAPILLPYTAAKGGLMMMTRNNAQALRPHKIRVFMLNIGWTATEQEHIVQLETGAPENWLELADESAPLGRILRPDDIAPMVTYLLSEQARMITGSIIEWDQTMILGPYDA